MIYVDMIQRANSSGTRTIGILSFNSIKKIKESVKNADLNLN